MDNKYSQKEIEALRHIRNWIVHNGHTPSIRELMAALNYKSPRSAQDILEQLEGKGAIKKFESGNYQLLNDPEMGPGHAQTIDVPIVGKVACGTPILAEENIEGYVSVSTTIAKKGFSYYLLRAEGDSMDKAGIDDGSLVLVRYQPVAEEGDKVVALIDDSATIKEYHRNDEAIILKPKSTNPSHKPIILTEDFQIQGIVIATITNL